MINISELGNIDPLLLVNHPAPAGHVYASVPTDPASGPIVPPMGTLMKLYAESLYLRFPSVAREHNDPPDEIVLEQSRAWDGPPLLDDDPE